MPRTIFDQKKQPDKLVTLIWGSASATGKTMDELAQIAGISISSLRRRKLQPGDFTITELSNISTGLGIPFDEIRAAIPCVRRSYKK